MCQQPWKEKSLGEVHNGSIIPINWTLLNRGFLSQRNASFKSQAVAVLGTLGEVRGGGWKTLPFAWVGGAPEPCHLVNLEPRNCLWHPQHFLSPSPLG